MNFINLLADEVLCGAEMEAIMGLVGYVLMAVKIAVPIILIVVGMFDLAKATTAKDENKIKEAQTALIKKAISAVAVFLVGIIVSLLMKIVGDDEWRNCASQCISTPGACKISNVSIFGDGSGN